MELNRRDTERFLRAQEVQARSLERIADALEGPKVELDPKLMGDNIEIKEPPEPCGVKRAAGWGNVASSCVFPKGHDKGVGSTPHSWVVQ